MAGFPPLLSVSPSPGPYVDTVKPGDSIALKNSLTDSAKADSYDIEFDESFAITITLTVPVGWGKVEVLTWGHVRTGSDDDAKIITAIIRVNGVITGVGAFPNDPYSNIAILGGLELTAADLLSADYVITVTLGVQHDTSGTDLIESWEQLMVDVTLKP